MLRTYRRHGPRKETFISENRYKNIAKEKCNFTLDIGNRRFSYAELLISLKYNQFKCYCAKRLGTIYESRMNIGNRF